MREVPLQQPVRIGRYQVVERLALGGMAELFKATMHGAHDFAKTVVVKKILPQFAADAEFVRMFIDEAKILSHLQHPKIVQVIELGESQDELFIAMEFVSGIDLLKLLRSYAQTKRKVPPELAAHCIAEVLDALDYAHNAADDDGQPLGIVHRDISPGNVLLSRNGLVKLTDFGIARFAQDHEKTQAGTLKGKYSYMSPEQVLHRPLDARSDLFAVGIVLSEILTCRRLFVAPSELELLIMVREVNLSRLDKHGKEIEPGLRTILHRALQRDPDDRYQSAAEFRNALSDWLFDRRNRVTPVDVAELVRSVLEPAETIGEFTEPQIGTLTGDTTRREQVQAANAAVKARESLLYSARRRGRATPSGNERPGDAATFALESPVGAGVRPDREGELAKVSPIRAVYELAVRGATGLLTLRRGAVHKHAYFVSGEAQFVDSNIKAERLGAFLVARHVITPDELATSLRVLPQFNGRLGEALIGLGMMTPMRALHWQTEQVREKLIDIASWVDGTFAWYAEQRRAKAAPVIHLDPYDVLGAACLRLDVHVLSEWAQHRANRVPRAIDNPKLSPSFFRLGDKPDQVRRLCDGRSLLQFNQAFASRAARIEAMQILYLMVLTDLVML